VNNVYCGCSDSKPVENKTDPGKTTPSAPTSDKKPIDLGKPLAKSGQFLWKPSSDKDGKLAVLLPTSLTGKVSEVVILQPDGSRARQKGSYAGVGNGDREHYRFSSAGDKFADGSIVLIKMKDGTHYNVKISETSKRFER